LLRPARALGFVGRIMLKVGLARLLVWSPLVSLQQ